MSARTAENKTDPSQKEAGLFIEILRTDRLVWDALRRARDLDLPDWMIVSGCLYQAAWNKRYGKPSGYGVKDVDLFYFDPSDPSYEAEDAVIRRGEAAFAGLAAPVEIRNQARVHLWYPERFGHDYPQLTHSAEALLYFASTTHAVGARLSHTDEIELFAPYGVSDIFKGRVTPNRILPNRLTHEKKGARIRALWPEIVILPWDED